MLSVSSPSHSVSLTLSPLTRFALVGFGKAVLPMTQAAEEIIGQARFLSGIVIAPNIPGAESPCLLSTVVLLEFPR
uniref:DUF4147 domain-containing protein n=1 Tax=Heterorhabditis bacteriophora TaxID=37862 RepID=A0A1I7X2R3_HETBA